MSKSKGNVVDPLEVMERYGTDALRFTLSALAAQGRDIRLSNERIEGYRNFANKLWNASRFVLSNLEGHRPALGRKAPAPLAERWIRSRLMRTVDSVRKSLAAYRFNEAAGAIYQFLWHEYCDWYLEWSKLTLYRGDDPAAKARVQSTLLEVLETTLRLLHPFMPFITEEIWQRLPKGRGAPASIMIARFPRVRRRDLDPAAEAAMAPIMGVVSALRNLRSELQIPPSRTLTAIVRPPAGTVATSLQETAASVAALARAEIQVDPEATRPPHSLLAIAEGCDGLRSRRGRGRHRGRAGPPLEGAPARRGGSRPDRGQARPGGLPAASARRGGWPGRKRAGRSSGRSRRSFVKASSGSMPWPPAEAAPDVDLTRAFASCLPGGRIAGPLHAYRSLTSTQTVARAWSSAGAPEGTVLLADHQSAGRGRQGRRWTAPPGTALLFSVILHPALPVARWPEIALAAGCAVAEGLEAVAPVSARLKWPNDVIVDGWKLAGILAEGVAGGAPHVVLGIGVNVSQLDADWPADLAGRARSLAASAWPSRATSSSRRSSRGWTPGTACSTSAASSRCARPGAGEDCWAAGAARGRGGHERRPRTGRRAGGPARRRASRPNGRATR
jgi:hypothetical protein